MSPVVPLAAVAASGLAAGLTAGSVVVGITAAGLTGAQYLLNRARRDDFARRNLGFTGEVSGAQVPQVVIYGKYRIGGYVTDFRVDGNSQDRKDAYKVVALCIGSEDGSGIEGVDEIHLDDALAISGPATGSLEQTTGVQSEFSGNLAYGLHLGTDAQAADSGLDSVFQTAYDTDDRGRGIAYLALKLTKDRDVFPGRPPKVTATVLGNRLYDPRDPTGGPNSDGWIWNKADSGLSLNLNPGQNPALMVLDYLTSKKYGLGASYPERDGGGGDSEIVEQDFIDAANYCDGLETIAGNPQPLFPANGVLDTGRRLRRNLDDLLSAFRGELVHQGGKFRLFVRQDQAPESLELTEDNIIGDWEFRRLGQEAAANSIVATFPDENQDYQAADIRWPAPGDANTFLTNDSGFANEIEVDLPFTTDPLTAQHVAMVLLKESRADAVVSVTCTEAALELQVGSVVKLTHPTPGWTDKEFWVDRVAILPNGSVRVDLREFDSTAYSLDAQSQPDSPPGTSLGDIRSIGAPTGLTLTSDDTTAVDTQDGAKVPAIKVEWTRPADEPFLSHYLVRYKKTSESQFRTWPDPDETDTEALIYPVKDGQAYDVEVYAINTVGVRSAAATGQVTVSTTPGTPQDIEIFGPDGREDMVLNGDFEDGLKYWRGTGASGSARLETGGDVISGGASIEIQGAAGGTIHKVEQSVGPDPDNLSGDVLVVRVTPGEFLHLIATGKVSDSGVEAGVGVRTKDENKSNLSPHVEIINFDGETSVVTKHGNWEIPSNVHFVTLNIQITGATDTDFAWFDDLHMIRVKDFREIMAARMANAGSVQDPKEVLSVPSNSVIDIAAHDLITPFGTISYDAGQITSLQSLQPHIVYADDPEWRGGAVTYQAVRNAPGDDISAAINQPGNYLVGKITTDTGAPATEGGGGGGTLF